MKTQRVNVKVEEEEEEHSKRLKGVKVDAERILLGTTTSKPFIKAQMEQSKEIEAFQTRHSPYLRYGTLLKNVPFATKKGAIYVNTSKFASKRTYDTE